MNFRTTFFDFSNFFPLVFIGFLTPKVVVAEACYPHKYALWISYLSLNSKPLWNFILNALSTNLGHIFWNPLYFSHIQKISSEMLHDSLLNNPFLLLIWSAPSSNNIILILKPSSTYKHMNGVDVIIFYRYQPSKFENHIISKITSEMLHDSLHSNPILLLIWSAPSSNNIILILQPSSTYKHMNGVDVIIFYRCHPSKFENHIIFEMSKNHQRDAT